MSFRQEMTAAYNDMLNVKTSLGYCRHNYAFHISPFIEFCAENYPNATEITKEMIDQWLVSKTFNADNTRRITIINIRHFTRYLNATGKRAYIPSSECTIKPEEKQKRYIPSQAAANIQKTFDNSGMQAVLDRSQRAEENALRVLAGNFEGM